MLIVGLLFIVLDDGSSYHGDDGIGYHGDNGIGYHGDVLVLVRMV